TADLNQSKWGYTPRFQQQITRAFDTDPAARATQDVGFDGLDNEEEQIFFKDFITAAEAKITDPGVLMQIKADPANDDYRYHRDTEYEENQTPVLARYKRFN